MSKKRKPDRHHERKEISPEHQLAINVFIAAECRTLSDQLRGLIRELLKKGTTVTCGKRKEHRLKTRVYPVKRLWEKLPLAKKELLQEIMENVETRNRLTALPFIGPVIGGIVRHLQQDPSSEISRAPSPDQITAVLNALELPETYHALLRQLAKEWRIDQDGGITFPFHYGRESTACLSSLDPAQVLQDQWGCPNLRFFPLIECMHAGGYKCCDKLLTPAQLFAHTLGVPPRLRFVLERLAREWTKCETDASERSVTITGPNAYPQECIDEIRKMLNKEGWMLPQLQELQKSVPVVQELIRVAGSTSVTDPSEIAADIPQNSANLSFPYHDVISAFSATDSFTIVTGPSEEGTSQTATETPAERRQTRDVEKTDVPLAQRISEELSEDPMLVEQAQELMNLLTNEDTEAVILARTDQLDLKKLGDAAACHPDTRTDVSLAGIRDYLKTLSLQMESVAKACWKRLQPFNQKYMQTSRPPDTNNPDEWKRQVEDYLEFLDEIPGMGKIGLNVPEDWGEQLLLIEGFTTIHLSMLQSLFIDYLWSTFPELGLEEVSRLLNAKQPSHARASFRHSDQRMKAIMDFLSQKIAELQSQSETISMDGETRKKYEQKIGRRQFALRALALSFNLEYFARACPIKKTEPPKNIATFDNAAIPRMESHVAREHSIDGKNTIITTNMAMGCGATNRLTATKHLINPTTENKGKSLSLRTIFQGSVPDAGFTIRQASVASHVPAGHAAFPGNILPIDDLPLSTLAKEQANRILSMAVADREQMIVDDYQNGGYNNQLEMLARTGEPLHICSMMIGPETMYTYVCMTPEQMNATGISLPEIDTDRSGHIGAACAFLKLEMPTVTMMLDPTRTSEEDDLIAGDETEQSEAIDPAAEVERLIKLRPTWPLDFFKEIVAAAGLRLDKGTDHTLVFGMGGRVYTLPTQGFSDDHFENGTVWRAIAKGDMNGVLPCLNNHPEWFANRKKCKRGNGGKASGN